MIGGIGSVIGSLPQFGGATNGVPDVTSTTSSFADVFQSAVGGVDHLQNTADRQVVQLLQGSGNADVTKTMVSVEKADVAFQLMMQVRNKVVNAYQEMEKMQF